MRVRHAFHAIAGVIVAIAVVCVPGLRAADNPPLVEAAKSGKLDAVRSLLTIWPCSTRC